MKPLTSASRRRTVDEVKRLREMEAAETDPVLKRAIQLEVGKLRTEIAIHNAKTTAALEAKP